MNIELRSVLRRCLRATGLTGVIAMTMLVFTACGGGGGGGGGSNSGGSNPQTPPEAPIGLQAVAGNGEVTLSFAGALGATSYTLYRATATGVTKSNYASLAGGEKFVLTPAESVSYKQTGLVNGTTYYYVVTASNAAGESAESYQVFATPVVKLIQAPTLLFRTTNVQTANGMSALMLVDVAGAPTPSYDWDHNGNHTPNFYYLDSFVNAPNLQCDTVTASNGSGPDVTVNDVCAQAYERTIPPFDLGGIYNTGDGGGDASGVADKFSVSMLSLIRSLVSRYAGVSTEYVSFGALGLLDPTNELYPCYLGASLDGVPITIPTGLPTGQHRFRISFDSCPGSPVTSGAYGNADGTLLIEYNMPDSRSGVFTAYFSGFRLSPYNNGLNYSFASGGNRVRNAAYNGIIDGTITPGIAPNGDQRDTIELTLRPYFSISYGPDTYPLYTGYSDTLRVRRYYSDAMNYIKREELILPADVIFASPGNVVEGIGILTLAFRISGFGQIDLMYDGAEVYTSTGAWTTIVSNSTNFHCGKVYDAIAEYQGNNAGGWFLNTLYTAPLGSGGQDPIPVLCAP